MPEPTATPEPTPAHAASAASLDRLAEAADEVAADQRQLARRARAASRRRRQGWSWSRILDRESEPGMLALLGRSSRRLIETAGRFRQALAAELGSEGHSTRAIAERLGVTHQRISAMLNGRGPATSRPSGDRR